MSFKVLPVFLTGYTQSMEVRPQVYSYGNDYYEESYSNNYHIELNIKAIVDPNEFGRNIIPGGATDCCLVFGSNSKLIRQRLLDTNLAEEYVKVANNFEDREKLDKEVVKLKETLTKLAKKKEYYEKIESENKALKNQNDLIKRENDEIKEKLSKYDKNPPEGTTRFNLIEVD